MDANSIDPKMTPDELEAEIERLGHVADTQKRAVMRAENAYQRAFANAELATTRRKIDRLRARLRAHNTRHIKPD